MLPRKLRSEASGRNTGGKPSVQPFSLDKVPSLVEVRVDGGVFQQGKILHCTEEGLMIDWECHGELASRIVPFGDTYCVSPGAFQDKDASPQGRTSVEVLVRRSPQEPRTWYPGILLNGIFEHHVSFGLVEVMLPDGAFAVVAPGYRIRRPQTEAVLEKLRFRKGLLVIHRVSLVGRNTAGNMSPQQVVDAWNQKSRFAADLFRPVRVDEETLEFVTIANDFLPKGLQIDAIVAMHELDTLLNKARKAPGSLQRQHKRKLSVADLDSSTEDNNALAPRISSIMTLPAEILQIVFGYLDSAKQYTLRLVCIYWNYVLRLPTVTCVLRVHYENNVQDYLSVASLHHGWTPQTRIIVNVGVYTNPIGQLFRMLVQRGLHSPVERLVVADVVFSLEEHTRSLKGLDFIGRMGRLVEELNQLASACRCLLLHNIQVNLGSEWNQWELQHASVHILNGRIVGCLTVKELWSRMDDSLPLLDPAQLQELSGRIDREKPYIPSQILNIVNEGNSFDPAHDAGAGNRFSTVDDLDLHRVNKVALHRLVAMMNRTSLKLAVSW